MNRLVVALEHYASTHSERVVIQRGTSTVVTTSATSFPFASTDELRNLAQQARVVVTHAGPSLLLEWIDAGRLPVVVPRLRREREHVDNHQSQFAQFLLDHAAVAVAWTISDLPALLEKHQDRASSTLPPADRASTLIRFASMMSNLRRQ